MTQIHTKDLFDLSHTLAAEWLSEYDNPWEALPGLSEYIVKRGEALDPSRFFCRGENIWIAKSASVADSACLCGPCIIDEDAEIRHCAYIRGSVIVGRGAVVGNSCEVKNAILFDRAQIPHFNYCGDSILGYGAHMAAGVITSNVKGDKTNVVIRCGDTAVETGMRKLGALLGDKTEIGCGTVLNPGTVIGRGTRVYPMSLIRGVLPAYHIYKNKNEIVPQNAGGQSEMGGV